MSVLRAGARLIRPFFLPFFYEKDEHLSIIIDSEWYETLKCDKFLAVPPSPTMSYIIKHIYLLLRPNLPLQSFPYEHNEVRFKLSALLKAHSRLRSWCDHMSARVRISISQRSAGKLPSEKPQSQELGGCHPSLGKPRWRACGKDACLSDWWNSASDILISAQRIFTLSFRETSGA